MDKGADVNKRGKYGHPPLVLFAVVKGHLEMVKFLVDKGADVNKKGNDGTRPLRLALQVHQRKMAEYLTQHGAKR